MTTIGGRTNKLIKVVGTWRPDTGGDNIINNIQECIECDNKETLESRYEKEERYMRTALSLLLHRQFYKPEKNRLEKLFKDNIKDARNEVSRINFYFKEYLNEIRLGDDKLISCNQQCWNCQFIKYNGNKKYVDDKGFPIKCENESINKRLKNVNDMLFKFTRR